MRKFAFGFLVLAIVTTLAPSCNDDYNAPRSMTNAFYNSYPTAVDVEWKRKRDHIVAEFRIPGQGECEAWYTKDGAWVMTSFDIAYSELPQAVRTAFEAEYGAMTPVDDVERLERNNNDTIYFIEAEIAVNGYPAEVYLDYAEDGTLLRTSVDVEGYDSIYYYL